MELHREPHPKPEAEPRPERLGLEEPTLSLILKGEDLLTHARGLAQVIDGRVRRVLADCSGPDPGQQRRHGQSKPS
jgi:hypothetical protein